MTDPDSRPQPSTAPGGDTATDPGVARPGVDASPASTTLPPAPRSSGGPPVLLMVVAAAILAIGAGVVLTSLTESPEPTDEARRLPPPPPVATTPAVELTLFVEQNEEAVELPGGALLSVGDTVLFEISAQQASPVRVWVEVDGQLPHDLGTYPATPEAGLLSSEEGLVAWGLGTQGTYVFKASSAEQGCPDGACDSVVVSVR